MTEITKLAEITVPNMAAITKLAKITVPNMAAITKLAKITVPNLAEISELAENCTVQECKYLTAASDLKIASCALALSNFGTSSIFQRFFLSIFLGRVSRAYILWTERTWCVKKKRTHNVDEGIEQKVCIMQKYSGWC